MGNGTMSLMLIVLIYCAALILGVIFYAFASLILYRRPTEIFWIKELFEKKEAYAHSIQVPKVVLAGGSNVLFGLKAKLIEQETGFKTINYGLASGLQPDYYFYRLRKVIKPGDTIILSLEYSFYGYNKDDGKIKEKFYRTYDRSFLWNQPLKEMLFTALSKGPGDLFDSITDMYKFYILKLKDSNTGHKKSYSKDCLNQNGDYVKNTNADIFLEKYNRGYYSPVAIPEEGKYETKGLGETDKLAA